MLDDSENRRQAERYSYRGYCALRSSQASIPAHIINLSNTGALIAVLDDHKLQDLEPVQLQVELQDGEIALLSGTVIHRKAHFIGLKCTPDSEADADKLVRFLAEAVTIHAP